MRFIQINGNRVFKCLECGAETAERMTHFCTNLASLTESEKGDLKLLNYRVEVEAIKQNLKTQSDGYDEIPENEMADYLRTVNGGLTLKYGDLHSELVTSSGV